MSVLERETDLLGRLKAIGQSGASLFAAACAERLRPILHRVPQNSTMLVAAKGLDMVWGVLEGLERREPERIAELSKACLAAIPSDADGESTPGVPGAYLEHVVAATHYALETCRSGDPQQAIWAARRGHEAADHRVLELVPDSMIDATAEQAIARHPLVSGEIARQDRDIREIEEAITSYKTIVPLAKRSHQRAREEGEKFVQVLLGEEIAPLV